jgi:serine/threonine protein kinase
MLSKSLGAEFIYDGENPSFLGKGLEGYVFRVRHHNYEQNLAMKVVLNDLIEEEFSLMKAAVSICPNLILSPVGSPITLHLSKEKSCGAFLLSEIGDKVKLTKTSMVDIITALVSLHTCNVIHGDPRHANILLFDGHLKWIDLRKSNASSSIPIFRSKDLKICIKSLFPDYQEMVNCYFNETANQTLLNDYGNEPTLAKARTLFFNFQLRTE